MEDSKKDSKSPSSDGYCDQRNIATDSSNLCDYFQSKRKKSKPQCQNCKHFQIIKNTADIKNPA